jgi:hypothetical protein
MTAYPLIPCHHDPDGGLELGGELIPEFLGPRGFSAPDTASHILALAFSQVWGMNGYTEGFDTADLKDAKALLAELT